MIGLFQSIGRTDVTHSPEPWSRSPGNPAIIRNSSGPIVKCCESLGQKTTHDNSARIVECVNAMKDVPDPKALMGAVIGLAKHGGSILLPDMPRAIRAVLAELDVELPS